MLCYNSMFIDKTIPITHLTVSESCELETLYEFFRGIPLLKYLKIERLSDDDYNGFNHLDYLNNQAVCLQQFIIHNNDWYQCGFYELIFKQTPNLTDLWAKMITLLIHQLKVFNFVFEIIFYDLCQDKVLKQFKRFQIDFWHKQHQWYTVCEFGDKSALIYTSPYCLNYIRLESDINIICDASISKSKLYDNITQLNFCVKRVNRELHYYLSNIKLLRLKLKFGYGLAPVVFNKQALKLLEMSVNLTNIKYLDISHLVHIESLLIFFIFAREGLSSIDSNDLMFILEYLSKLSYIKIKCSPNLDLSVEDLNEKLQELDSKLKKHFFTNLLLKKSLLRTTTYI
ncbi:unnamed protein product [Adineta steineri]|uniref:Uncharacterized protein n=1 Tax=Adineta steineri TaxID=433720 RepID=A0A814AWT5_9BILA|nr:unnamed protein product [Adineta steineri]CAF0920708.1 unnamed protein product [Adineta steineri]